MKDIEILIITYNQHDVISRAIDSILSQADFGLKDIVICDDCSTDDNWQVISEYAKKYPQFIKAYRNESNLGIYGNVNKVVSLKNEADLYYLLSGDDAFCPGLFQRLQCFVKDKPIEEVACSVYFDWKIVDVQGQERIFSNAMVDKGFDNKILWLRGLITSRSIFLSRSVIDQYEPVDLTHGVAFSEWSFDRRPVNLSKVFYYFPFVGSIYYSGIGVSSFIRTKSQEYHQSELYKWQYIYSSLDKKKNRKERYFAKARICLDLIFLKSSPLYFIPALWYDLLGWSPRYGESLISRWLDSYGFLKVWLKSRKHYENN